MSIIQLSSATDKSLNGISIGNIPMKMLVCLTDGYYDIGAWIHENGVFTVHKGDKSYLGLESNLQLMCFYITCWHAKRG